MPCPFFTFACLYIAKMVTQMCPYPGGEFGGRSGRQSGPVQSYNSPVEHRFLIGLDRSTNGLLPDCDRKYVSVRTMPPGYPDQIPV